MRRNSIEERLPVSLGWWALLLLIFLTGCAVGRHARNSAPSQMGLESPQVVSVTAERTSRRVALAPVDSSADSVRLDSGQDDKQDGKADPLRSSDSGDPGTGRLSQSDVVTSIHSAFPLLEAAYLEEHIAAGNQLAALGGFDLALQASSENKVVGFYETYRQQSGLSLPLYTGGRLTTGYRNGRGDFEPWYGERSTDRGGELSAAVRVPLLRNRSIDARRAELWRRDWDRQRVLPEIRGQLIRFVRDGSIAYWEWVAAGQKSEIGRLALELAQTRNAQLERKIEVGDIDPPVLQDNLRSIAEREARLVDLNRKLRQAAIKLSLYYRDADGAPLVPDASKLNEFPTPVTIDVQQLRAERENALATRPELAVIDAQINRVEVDLLEAQNLLLPELDAQFAVAQDLGSPASSFDNKSEFELEAGLFLEAPIQRRNALGRRDAASARRSQLMVQRRFVADTIALEVDSAIVALEAAFKRFEKAREARQLAEYMADVERRKFDLGESDLLAVALREQFAVEAGDAEVQSQFEYFSAAADFDAALARDWPSLDLSAESPQAPPGR